MGSILGEAAVQLLGRQKAVEFHRWLIEKKLAPSPKAQTVEPLDSDLSGLKVREALIESRALSRAFAERDHPSTLNLARKLLISGSLGALNPEKFVSIVLSSSFETEAQGDQMLAVALQSALKAESTRRPYGQNQALLSAKLSGLPTAIQTDTFLGLLMSGRTHQNLIGLHNFLLENQVWLALVGLDLRWDHFLRQIIELPSSPDFVAISEEPTLMDALLPQSKFLVDKVVKFQTEPLVTVIMPAYNAAETISYALGSILAQEYDNLEILVVDDGSSDRTKRIVEEISIADSRVRWFSTNVNSGPYVARNIALYQAKGKYVTVQDADDYSSPRRILVQVEELENRNELVAVLTSHLRISSQLRLRSLSLLPNLSSLMFRREAVLAKAGFWDSEPVGGDAELLSRLRAIFGESSVNQIVGSAMSLTLHRENSLTQNREFGLHQGFSLSGFRRLYSSRYAKLHSRTEKEHLYVEFGKNQQLMSDFFSTRNPPHDNHIGLIGDLSSKLTRDFILNHGSDQLIAAHSGCLYSSSKQLDPELEKLLDLGILKLGTLQAVTSLSEVRRLPCTGFDQGLDSPVCPCNQSL